MSGSMLHDPNWRFRLGVSYVMLRTGFVLILTTMLAAPAAAQQQPVTTFAVPPLPQIGLPLPHIGLPPPSGTAPASRPTVNSNRPEYRSGSRRHGAGVVVLPVFVAPVYVIEPASPEKAKAPRAEQPRADLESSTPRFDVEPAAAAPPPPAPAALTISPATTPMTLYVIPGCYAGNVPPDSLKLPAGCDKARATTLER